MSSDAVEQVKNSISLANYIGRYVKLTRRGNTYKGLCPFHKEKTPSFNVDDAKGYFHCFGCGASGDIFAFVNKNQGLDFSEALKMLALEAGITLPTYSKETKEFQDTKSRLYQLNQDAKDWFIKQLYEDNGRVALDYVKNNRQLSNETIKNFEIGYAPNSYKLLGQYLQSKGYSLDVISLSGICYLNDDNSLGDSFRNRLMFPIKDNQGRVVGFGGRILGEGNPKYLNSKESAIFQKSEILYGLYEAVKNRKNNNPLIVVEGYMDVISLHQAGFSGAIAPLGTAFGDSHLYILNKYTNTPVFCFDGDTAGYNASLKAAKIYIRNITPNLMPKFITLQNGDDPDSFIKANGFTAFNELIAKALPLSQFLWEKLSANYDISLPENRSQLEQNLIETVNTINNPISSKHFTSFFKEQMRSATGNFWFLGNKNQNPHQLKAKEEARNSKTIQEQIELSILFLMLHFPEIVENISESISKIAFSTTILDSLCATILNKVSEQRNISYEDLKKELDSDYRNELIEIERNNKLMLNLLTTNEKALSYFNEVVYNNQLLLEETRFLSFLYQEYKKEENDDIFAKCNVLTEHIASLSKQIEQGIKSL